jgi:hypothetical protein
MSVELEKLIQEEYVPSEVERKKAVMMYFFVGILPALAGKKMSLYEIFHLKQALGWWFVFFVFLVLSSFLWFVPFVKILPFLIFVGLVVVWVLFVKQAWEGKYFIKEDKIFAPIFYSIGSWIVNIFDIQVEKKEDKDLST